MPTSKTRIKDIARLAGVSIGTIDRVLHNRGEVADQTRQKVLSILKETNYSPNLMAQALKSKKRFHLISLLPEPEPDNPFWSKHPIGIERALDELFPFQVSMSQVTFDMQSEEDFQVKANDVLKLKPDGVILAPIFKSESITFCSLLSSRSIPFVFIDGFIEDAEFLAYIGEDTYRSGRVAAQLLDIITPKNKDILIVTIANNIQNVHHLNTRAEGFLSYFGNHAINNGSRFSINITNPSSESVQNELDKILFTHPEIRSIFMTGSRSYLIADYLEKRELKSVNLVGYDLLDKNVKYLKSGVTRFLIGQRPEEQSYRAIKKMFEYLSLKKIPVNIEYLPVDVVTSENVDFFLK